MRCKEAIPAATPGTQEGSIRNGARLSQTRMSPQPDGSRHGVGTWGAAWQGAEPDRRPQRGRGFPLPLLLQTGAPAVRNNTPAGQLQRGGNPASRRLPQAARLSPCSAALSAARPPRPAPHLRNGTPRWERRGRAGPGRGESGPLRPSRPQLGAAGAALRCRRGGGGRSLSRLHKAGSCCLHRLSPPPAAAAPGDGACARRWRPSEGCLVHMEM